jgi:hypothetical protein
MAFVKGQSGNPNGRPKVPEGARKRAETISTMGLERMADIIENGEAKDAVGAWKAVSAYAWGTPLQSVEHSGEVGDNRPQIILNVSRVDADTKS